VGKDPCRIELHMQQLVRGLRMFHGYPWFVEFALWDLIGKRAGLPLHRLFGGGKTQIRAYCSTAGLYDAAEIAERLRPLLERGFTAIKLRAHRTNYRQDIEALEAAREVVGPDVVLMVDANQSNMPAYGLIPGAQPAPFWDYQTALAFGRAIEPLGLAWLEDPLPGGNMEGLAMLRAKLDTPIAGAETEVGIQRYRQLCQAGCFDVVQPDAAFSGGILETWKIGAIAASFGVQCVPHIWGTAHSVAANLQLAAALPNCNWMECPHDPPSYPLEVRDALLMESLGPEADGLVRIPEGPGLGVETNWDAVENYRVR
jgi:D-galactarolactone cycloisomerase